MIFFRVIEYQYMPEKILILKSGVCGWGRCIFCGYGRMPGAGPSREGLKKEFDGFFAGVSEGDTVKVFGSGSFLDGRQVPKEAREYFIECCRRKKAGKLHIESRPEYINQGILSEFAGLDVSVGIGLEIADDLLLEKIKKGFNLADYVKGAKTIHDAGFKVRTYLLVNPPYTEDARGTLDKSVEYALEHSDTIVLINLLPHGNTPIFRMWVSGEWNYLSREEFQNITDKWKDHPKIELDAETFRFIPKFPKEARESLKGVGEEYLTHPHYEVWQDYIRRWYRPPEERKILLFLPCSYAKPYSESATHKGIIKALKETGMRENIHEVMLSNAGVIPREFENLYPFNAYDWDERLETEETGERYMQVTEERIKKYLKAHKKNYKDVFCFLKYDSESCRALMQACESLGMECRNLLRKETYEEIKAEKKPLQHREALKDLSSGLTDKR